MRHVTYLILSFLPLLMQGAIDPALLQSIQKELNEPVRIHLGSQRVVSGHVVNVSNNQLQLNSAEGAGEVAFTFEREQVQRFELPGESYKALALEWIDTGKTAEAYHLMQLLFEQRKALIPLLPASESHFFVYYVRLILDSPKPARAIAIADLLRPQIQNESALHALDDAILESYYSIALYDAARPLAEAWVVERDPHSESALGYFVLASDKLRSDHFEAALELALQPIVFASIIPVAKLADCYAAGISAALGLREKDYAISLYLEMQERQLAWPINDPTLKPFYEKILHYIEAQ